MNPVRQVSMQYTDNSGKGQTLTISEPSESSSCTDFLQRACTTMSSLVQPPVAGSTEADSGSEDGLEPGEVPEADAEADEEASSSGGGAAEAVEERVLSGSAKLDAPVTIALGRAKRKRQKPEKYSPVESPLDDDSGDESEGETCASDGSESEESCNADEDPTESDLEFIASDDSASSVSDEESEASWDSSMDE